LESLRTELAAAKAVLKSHHLWHLEQTHTDDIGVVPSDAYAESDLCNRTIAALAAGNGGRIEQHMTNTDQPGGGDEAFDAWYGDRPGGTSRVIAWGAWHARDREIENLIAERKILADNCEEAEREAEELCERLRKISDSVKLLDEAIDQWEPRMWRRKSEGEDTRYRTAIYLTSTDPVRYAVREMGECLNTSGQWEYEPQPSSRDDAFFARCRFPTFEAAVAAAEKSGR
jgi:hypothetical protein